MRVARERIRAGAWGVLSAGVLALLIVVGSRNLDHFAAALVGYTFATIFATFGITYRYAMWLQRPPTRLYWRRGWQMFATPRFLGPNVAAALRRFFLEFAANRFIFRRGRLRGPAHWLIMWGCVVAAAITFPLVRAAAGRCSAWHRAPCGAIRRTGTAPHVRRDAMATLPVSDLKIIEGFGPHLSGMTGIHLSTAAEPERLAIDAPYLLVIPRVFLYVALAAWSVALIGLARHVMGR